MQLLNNFIDGKWREPQGNETFFDRNPADTREIVAKYHQSTDEEAQAAIEAADKAFSSWKRMPAPQRGDLLFKIANLMEQEQQSLARAIVQEMGKTYGEALKEVGYAAGIFRFFAGEGTRLNGSIIASDSPDVQIQVIREALGVVLVITPWNFPLSIASWKIAPALICGNTVVFKASSETPMLGMKLAEIIQKAGVPDGVVNYLIGSGKMVNRMIEHPAIKAVTFTGSNSVGNKIYETASKNMKRVLLEMGGKNPLLVLEDANIDEAVELAVRGGFGQAGQTCTATGRVIVHSKVLREFTDKLVERTKKIKIGNGLLEGIDMGPQVSAAELESTLKAINGAVEEGASLLIGGDASGLPEAEHGYFILPAVLCGVAPSMSIAKEEVFGPVLSVIEAADLDEAIQIANDVEYGLTAAVCTNNLNHMMQALHGIEAGVVKINMTSTGTSFQAPFGGYKGSSTGTYKELGREAIDFYCREKTGYIKWN